MLTVIPIARICPRILVKTQHAASLPYPQPTSVESGCATRLGFGGEPLLKSWGRIAHSCPTVPIVEAPFSNRRDFVPHAVLPMLQALGFKSRWIAVRLHPFL